MWWENCKTSLVPWRVESVELHRSRVYQIYYYFRSSEEDFEVEEIQRVDPGIVSDWCYIYLLCCFFSNCWWNFGGLKKCPRWCKMGKSYANLFIIIMDPPSWACFSHSKRVSLTDWSLPSRRLCWKFPKKVRPHAFSLSSRAKRCGPLVHFLLGIFFMRWKSGRNLADEVKKLLENCRVVEQYIWFIAFWKPQKKTRLQKVVFF